MTGKIYEEMDWSVCKIRREEEAQRCQIKIRQSHLVQIGIKLSLHFAFRSDMSSEKDIILYED